jgi:hypothetical protein
MNYTNGVEKDGFPTAIKSMLEGAKNAKLSQTRAWDLSLMYLNGQQNVRYDKSLQQYVTLRFQPGRNQLIVNLILNMYRAIVSRLATNYPGISVMPASPSNEDIIKAKSSEEALKYFYHSQSVKRELTKAIEWLVSCGNVGLKEYYDADDDCIKLSVISPYDLFFEAGCSNPEESAFIACRKIVRKTDLEKAYPQHAEDIKNAESLSSDQSEDNTFPHTQSYDGESYYYPRVEIFDVYFRDGHYGVVLGNKYLFKGKSPIKGIPVQFIRYTNLPDKLWGTGMIANILDLQNLYNKVRNQIVQNVELMSNPKWLIPKTSGVNGSSIRGTPGEKIYYNPAGGVPQQLEMKGMPSYVLDHIAKLQSEMLDVAGVHSTTLGKRAVGVTSGKAIEALANQDVSQLVMTQENIESAVKHMSEIVLQMMKVYYTEERFINMMDATGKLVWRTLSQTNIVDKPEVFIEAGSLFRDESQDRDAKVLNLLELGLIDKPTAMRELSFKTGNAMVLEEIQSRNHVQDMLDAVILGAQIEIFATDDIDKFKQIFGDYMKTPNYYELPQQTQDYMRDILVALATYTPPDPKSPEENRVKYRVFPEHVKPSAEDELLQQLVTQSPQAAEQQLEGAAEDAMLTNAMLTQRGQVRQQPQGNDLAVINRRATE